MPDDRHLPATLRFMLAARRCEQQGLDALDQACKLVDLLSELVHALQRERGFSNIYLGQPQPRLLATLARYSDQSRGLEQQVLDHLEGFTPDSADRARLCNRIAHMLHGLDHVQRLRLQIHEQRIPAEQANAAFTRLIGNLLAVVFETADSAIDPRLSRALVALFNFMQGKELAGQERACGVIGFSQGYFDPQRQQQMHFLASSQQRSLDIFSHYASPASVEHWQRLEHDNAQVRRLRELALRTDEQQPVDSGLAEVWFEQCSARIDAMHQLERQMSQALRELCQSTRVQAQTELDNHRLLLRHFASADEAEQPLLFSVQGRALNQVDPDSSVQRSLHEVLQEQSRHLQQLQEQLQEARSTLLERRRIEQAKYLLMERHRLSEQEAHQRMQRAAMNQGLRLGDIAEQLLAAGTNKGRAPQ